MLGCELKASIDESSKDQICSEEEEPWVEIWTGIYLLRARPAFLLHILRQVGLPQLRLQLPESWDVLRIFHAILTTHLDE